MHSIWWVNGRWVFKSIYENNKIYSRDNDSSIYEAKVNTMKKTIFDILELAKNNKK